MRAIVLAAGESTRMDTTIESKCLLEVNGRPLLSYSLSMIEEANLSSACVVISPQGSAIREQMGKQYGGLTLEYAVQEAPLGIPHAVQCCADYIGGEPFAMFLADEIYLAARLDAMLAMFLEKSLSALCSYVRVDDPNLIRRNYSISLANDGSLSQVVEKPEVVDNDMRGTGICLFANEVLNLIPSIAPNEKTGRSELADLLQHAIDNGLPSAAFEIAENYFNINTPAELLEAKQLLERVSIQ